MVKPNFTGASIKDGKVTVRGESGIEADGSTAEFDDDVLAIRVALIQGDRMEERAVDGHDPTWTATFTVADQDGGDPDYEPGPAVAIGIELRKENATVINWTEPLNIL
jgi:hypothetical protein